MPPLPYQQIVQVPSLRALSSFTQRLADFLKPGDVVALDGSLGAGKTTFTQNLARALGVTESVGSPTFVLMNEYLSGAYPIAHVDLYRLGEERAASLADELFAVAEEGRALLLVEWACYGRYLEEITTVSLLIEADASENATDESRCITVMANRPLLQSPMDAP